MDLWSAISEYDVRRVIAFVSVQSFLLHFRDLGALVIDLRGWISQDCTDIAFLWMDRTWKSLVSEFSYF